MDLRRAVGLQPESLLARRFWDNPVAAGMRHELQVCRTPLIHRSYFHISSLLVSVDSASCERIGRDGGKEGSYPPSLITQYRIFFLARSMLQVYTDLVVKYNAISNLKTLFPKLDDHCLMKRDYSLRSPFWQSVEEVRRRNTLLVRMSNEHMHIPILRINASN